MSRPPLDDINNIQGLINLGPVSPAAPVASFNENAIENLIQTKGFKALHYIHGLLTDRETLRGPDNPNTQGAALRGVMYYSVRELLIVPQQFKLEDRLTVQGLYGVGSVMFNASGHYTDGQKEKNYISKRDLLVFPDLTDMARQLFEWNPTGPMKLNYKVKGIDLLYDSNTYYTEGGDYEIGQDGLIHWLKDGRKPKFVNGKPSILACVYYYTPIYIVENLPHSIRVVPSNVFGHAAFPREMTYLPQLIVAKPSTLMEENDILDWHSIPPYNSYPASGNTTGGSR